MTTSVNVDLYYKLFHILHHAGSVIVPIRYRRVDEEEIFSGDYDFLINPEHLASALNAMREFLSGLGVTFAIWKRKQGKTRIDILEEERKIVRIELWSFLESHKIKNAHPCIPWENIKKHVQPSLNSYTGFSLTPEVEALYYLCHLQEKQKSLKTPLVIERLEYYKSLEGVSDDTRKAFEELCSDKDIDKAGRTSGKKLQDMGILTSSTGISGKMARLSQLLNEERHRLILQKAKIHRFIFVVGPDGSGKTSLIRRVAEENRQYKYVKFKNIYRKNPIYSIYYPVAKLILQKKHGIKMKKNHVDDISSPFLMILAIIGMFFLNILNTVLLRRALCDRSPADLLIQGHRFATESPMVLKRKTIWRSLIPAGRATIHLHAGADVIRSRKPEMSNDQIASYQQALFDAYLQKQSPLYLCINTEHSIESCAKAIVHFLKMQERRSD